MSLKIVYSADQTPTLSEKLQKRLVAFENTTHTACVCLRMSPSEKGCVYTRSSGDGEPITTTINPGDLDITRENCNVLSKESIGTRLHLD
ncbi:hypothetical protein EGR_06942 [Echinococcus granulosus]|uniref:Uncharacterized protein n=1 Tax=Echinococcus granulosus TaxID=6210 RepID=W6U9Y3_ECHGR|nr:hypothetical protein EGR_06942 [Echinococcus granulosus]EUB58198.1 hypothetical protein EGR_06942 [Echinococcus granulosus]